MPISRKVKNAEIPKIISIYKVRYVPAIVRVSFDHEIITLNGFHDVTTPTENLAGSTRYHRQFPTNRFIH